ncbi:Chaperone protein dnaJ 72 [Acorus calamus]|uniref:Chaperone protein dnaJ 72 n=1 Tax=Acorus calamus TaxID=4465 RepID=A0AAV9D2Y7_ACOCL|nr:Chaperone protein dnaJ 72 [Acorus calamus]
MDHYRTLGLRRGATKEEIKEAFRRSAMEFHPDKHSVSSKEARDMASLRFRQANEAYQVLVDDRRRAEYDLRGHSAAGGGGGGGYGASSRYGYGNRGGGGGGSGRSGRGAPSRFEFEAVFRFLSTKASLRNLVFASILLGGVLVIDRSGEEIWKMNNSGKSFEEAIDSIEKFKIQRDKG